MTENTQTLTEIGKLIFTFARIDRVVLLEDGETPESDTDHTVMLSVCACALAERLYPHLDRGKIAQYALVHDLVEVHAGDTNTFNISARDNEEKEKREAYAFELLQKEFSNAAPWIPDTIAAFNSQESSEARFVDLLDKMMTLITHVINRGAFMKKRGITKEETTSQFTGKLHRCEERFGKEFPEMIGMIRELINATYKDLYNETLV